MATQNPKNQLALGLGDTTAKLTVRDLVVRGEIETPAPSVRKPRPVPTFERALVDGADCALRRRCGAKSELLVLLATQGQAYVMDEPTGRRRALTAGRLASFCSGAHDKSADTDTTSSESDHVTGVSEHLTISESDGVWLSRTVEHERGDARKPAPYGWRDTARTVCIVSQRRMPDVLKISCDGELVWPEEQAGIEGEIGRLEQMVEQLH